MRVLASLILVIVALIVIFFVAQSRIPDMLANNLSKKLGVPVSIGSMSFSPHSIEADHFEIGNPSGYSLPKAFSAEEIDVDAPLSTYLKDEIVIDLVEVKNIYLGLEFDSTRGTEGNWKKILSNYQKNADLDATTGKRVTIKRMVFTNIETDLLFRDQAGNIRKLPKIGKIELTDISTEGGFPTDQLMGSILGQMIRQVFIQQNLGNFLDGILNAPGGAVDTFLKPFKGIFNSAPRAEKIDVA